MKELTPSGTFRSPFHRTRMNILYTALWLNQYIRNFMQQFELTPQQYNILKIISCSEKPMNVLQIRNKMFEKLSDTSRLINRLESKQLLIKKKSEDDKRIVEITITEKGMELVNKIGEQMLLLDEPMKGLSETEADELTELLVKLRKTSSKKSEY